MRENQFQKERWRAIDGYHYDVSNYGRVRNSLTKQILSLRKNFGYNRVALYDSLGHPKNVFVHRLVAEAFIPNPQKLPYINHKDEDKGNNYVGNLEWCTASYNCLYGTKQSRRRETYTKRYCRSIVQLSPSGKLIAQYRSAIGASEATGILASSISSVARGKGTGKRKSAGGFIWLYADDYHIAKD